MLNPGLNPGCVQSPGMGQGTGSERGGQQGTRLRLPRRAAHGPGSATRGQWQCREPCGAAGMLRIPSRPAGTPARGCQADPAARPACCTSAVPGDGSVTPLQPQHLQKASKAPSRAWLQIYLHKSEYKSVTYPHHALGTISAHQPDLFIVCKPLEGVFETITC